MRLIDADALIQANCGACEHKRFCVVEICRHYDFRKRIKNAPTIEPERKKGHINICNGFECCSECGKCLGIGYTNYCGYCGAELEVT